MSIKEYKKIIKKIYSDFKKKYPEEYKRQMDIKQKSDDIAEKENERFGQFIGKQVNDLKLELGVPTDDYINDLGNETLVYKTKKYGIPCERKFEINANGTIVGFSSSGCI